MKSYDFRPGLCDLRWLRWLPRRDRRYKHRFHWQAANLWPLSARGGVLLEPPTNTASPGHWSHRRWSRRGNQDLKVINLHPMLYRMMQSPIFFQRFRCVLDWSQSVGSCGISNILGLIIRIGTRSTLWFRHSREAIGEEDDGGIWIEFYVFFTSDIFMYILECTLSRFNISPLPFKKKNNTVNLSA